MVSSLISAEVRENYRLYLQFEDGVKGEVSIRALTQFKGVFSVLRDREYFQRCAIDPESGRVAWPNDTDIDPLVLYARIRRIPTVFDRLIFETLPLDLSKNLDFLRNLRNFLRDLCSASDEHKALRDLVDRFRPSYKQYPNRTKIALTLHKDEASFEDIQNARFLCVELVKKLAEDELLDRLGAIQVSVQPCALLEWPSGFPTQIASKSKLLSRSPSA